MKVCMLVTSNVIKDPRVQKEAQISSDNQMDVYVLGRKDYVYNQEYLKHLPYNVTLIDKKREDNDSLIKRIIERFSLGINFYKESIKIKPDLIHANDFDTLPFAWLAAKKLKCPIVYDSHEIWTENGSLANKRIAKKIIQLIEKFLIKRVNKVISVSNSASSKLAEMYGIEKPIVVTNCPYSSLDAITDVHKSEMFEIVYQGIYSSNRGYEEFILAARELATGTRLVLRGYGPIEKKLRDLVESNNLEDVVKFKEPVEVFELTKAAASSHLGVVLTKPISVNYEFTVSNKLFEYIHAGIPVILSNVREHKYLIDKFGFGIIINDVTPIEISKAINKIYNDKKLYDQLKQNAQRAALELCWEKEGGKIINIYKEILNKERS